MHLKLTHFFIIEIYLMKILLMRHCKQTLSTKTNETFKPNFKNKYEFLSSFSVHSKFATDPSYGIESDADVCFVPFYLFITCYQTLFDLIYPQICTDVSLSQIGYERFRNVNFIQPV